METKIYQVLVECCITKPHEYTQKCWEVYFRDHYPAEEIATEKAKKEFELYSINDYCEAVHACVTEYAVTNDGMKEKRRVFNLFKRDNE